MSGSEETHDTVPQAGSTFLPDLQAFLRQEDAERFQDMFQSFVVSGGIHGTSAGLTGTPTALVAYPGGFYTTETASITYPNSSTIWVIAHKDNTGTVANFNRVSGTHYCINTASPTQPTQPANTVYLMKVVTSGGAITAVTDLRTTTPIIQRITYLLDHHAVGDGITPDEVALQAAISSGAKVIDGSGLTYKINAPITGFSSDQTIQHATFDFSSMPAQGGQDRCFTIEGSIGSAVALTANSLIDSFTIQVGDTSTFAAEQWVWLESTAIWSAIDGTPYGQLAKVKTVDSGVQLTLYEGVVVPFNTADSATIAPVTPIERPRFKNVRILGAVGTDQVAAWYNYALDGTDEGLVIENVENAGVVWYRCMNMRGTGTVRNATGTNAYGYGVYGGSYGCKVIGGHGDYLRHFVTVGDNDGINLYTIATGNTCTNMRSAGLDTHVASMHATFADNQVSLTGDATTEGITMQGLHMIAQNNTIKGVGNAGIGIFMQPLVTASGFESQAIIQNNRIYFNDTSTGTVVGIHAQVEATNGTNFSALSISNNQFYGGANASATYQIYIQAAKTSSAIRRVTLNGNVSTDGSKTHAAYLRAQGDGSVIQFASLVGNHFKASGTYAVILQASGTSANVDSVTMVGNTLDGGSTANLGILASGGSSTVTKVIENDNTFVNGTLLYNLSGTTTGLKLKSADMEPVTTVTGASYTVNPLQNDFIVNRAGTVTFTLPAALDFPGRPLRIKTIQAQAVVSFSADVQPLDDTTLGTAILPATDGAWCLLKSNGTNWIVMQRGT